jgi:hypothetical protein
MKTTKKLPVAINPRTGQARAGKDFLIPFPAASETSGFVGIQSGKRYASGALVYLGMGVTSADILKRAEQSLGSDISLPSGKQLDAYLAALADFKIGNVLSISYSVDGSFALSKIAEMCQPQSKSKLP